MTPYADLAGRSGIAQYQAGDHYLDVRFKDGALYRYTRATVGQPNLTMMVALAGAGHGLNAYINRNVRDQYAAKFA
ncbi:hypothetical protein [Pseudoroseicyclus sp. CXY001]|uniref:hypothetical protein n=1 Tax=Pseudoroseicyclus sp. CXY001 TaxID=3242492 RepID=UPI00358DC31E